MYHYRKTKQSYRKLNHADKPAACPFPSCNETSTQVAVSENTTMYVLPNRISYDVFEGQKVTDHLMVIPKRHVESIERFTNQEKIDQMSLIGEYEAKGYNIYARGNSSATRSVQHQHTHLIKTSNKKASFMMFSEKPYYLVNF